MDLQAVGWLAVLVLMLLIEAITLGLTTIWFAGGALVGFLLSLLDAPFVAQLISFCAVSLILLLFTRPAAVRWINKDRVKTNAESLIGTTAVVTERICNLEESGRVQVKGQEWTARSMDDAVEIQAGKKVLIQKISGVKLIVKEE